MAELIILILIASSCAIVGTFLVIKNQSMITDAISHSVLLGIVLAFLVVRQLGHPLLIIGAALVGVLTAFLSELFQKAKNTNKDAAIGAVFPLLFSIAVILISTVLKNAHICEKNVLVGDISFIAYQFIPGTKFPMIILTSGIMLLVNILFTALFFKELKISSFDPHLAKTLGINATLIFYVLIFNTSLTTVISFDAIGSILVISFTIAPAATALLLTKDLKWTILVSILIGVSSAIIGYFIADSINLNYSGTIATTQLLMFLIVSILEPRGGVLFNLVKRKFLKEEYAILIMILHIAKHEINNFDTLSDDLNWNKLTLQKRIRRAIRKDYLSEDNIVTEKAYSKIKELGL